MEITPAPTDEEAAAIAVAVQMMWPTAQPAQRSGDSANVAPWRFSRRWWSAADRAATWGTRPL